MHLRTQPLPPSLRTTNPIPIELERLVLELLSKSRYLLVGDTNSLPGHFFFAHANLNPFKGTIGRVCRKRITVVVAKERPRRMLGDQSLDDCHGDIIQVDDSLASFPL